MAIVTGTHLGAYQILALLGAGARGEVYLISLQLSISPSPLRVLRTENLITLPTTKNTKNTKERKRQAGTKCSPSFLRVLRVLRGEVISFSILSDLRDEFSFLESSNRLCNCG